MRSPTRWLWHWNVPGQPVKTDARANRSASPWPGGRPAASGRHRAPCAARRAPAASGGTASSSVPCTTRSDRPPRRAAEETGSSSASSAAHARASGGNPGSITPALRHRSARAWGSAAHSSSCAGAAKQATPSTLPSRAANANAIAPPKPKPAARSPAREPSSSSISAAASSSHPAPEKLPADPPRPRNIATTTRHPDSCATRSARAS